jgi:hypothetical protein
VAVEEHIVGDAGDADQLGTEAPGRLLDFIGHGREILNRTLPVAHRAVRVAQLPGVGDHMAQHSPRADRAEEVVQRLPLQRIRPGAVEHLGWSPILGFAQAVDLIAGSGGMAIAERISGFGGIERPNPLGGHFSRWAGSVRSSTHTYSPAVSARR